MKITLHLVWQSIKLYARIRGYIFFIFLLPMIIFFLYMSIFADGKPERVTAFLGPLLAMAATSQGLYGVAGDLVRSREWRMLIPYQLASLSRAHMVASQLILATVVVIVVGATQIALAVLVYGVHLHTSPLILLAVLCVGTLAIGGMGVVFLSMVNTSHESDMVLQLAFLLFVIVSGMTVPFTSLPHYVQNISSFLPTTILVLVFQNLILKGESLASQWPQLLILTLFFVASTGIATNLFRWDNEQKATRSGRLAAALCVVPLLIGGIWLRIR